MEKLKKGGKRILVLLTIYFLLPVITAPIIFSEEDQPLLPYFYDPAVPRAGELKLADVFNVNLYTGAANSLYPISLPQGTNNLQPKLNLIYNSHTTTGYRPKSIGAGWDISQSYIQRDVNYTFADASDDKFELVLDEFFYDLTYVSNESRFHTEIESYFNIQNVSGGNNTNDKYWILKTRDGTQYRFGFNNDSELVSNLYDYTVRWSLDLINDTYGNSIYYTYKEDPNPNDVGTVYPHKIEYNNDRTRSIEFILEDSDRPDKWIAYEQGNKVVYSRRLKEITASVNGALVKRYSIGYSSPENLTSISYISNITLYGKDDLTYFPPINFKYKKMERGWVEDSSWMIPNCGGGENKGCLAQGERVRLADVNGDGLVDILLSDYVQFGSEDQEVWINNGTGWEQDTTWIIPNCDDEEDKGCFDRGARVRLADANGDGLVDVLYASFTAYSEDQEVWINNGTSPFLLESITTRFGGTFLIDYKRSTSLDNTGNDSLSDLGFNLWVVANITKDNGMNGSQQVISITKYNYSGGKYEYYPKNEFRGFNYVEETLDDKKIRHWFHQDNGRKSREYETQILDENENTYLKKEFAWNSSIKNNYSIVLLIEQSEYSYDNISTNPKIVNISYDYDEFGNLVEIHYKGDVDDSKDDKYEYFNYLSNSDKWIINKIENSSLFDSTNSVKIKESLYSYDNLNYGQAPTKGSLTSKQDWLDIGENPVTNYSYDSYGNIVNETNAKGYTTKYVYGIRDSTYTFVDKIINSKGHIIEYEYNLGTGNIIWQIDTNNQVTNYTYDVFGRIEKEILPYDSETYPTKRYTYELDGTTPEKIKISQTEGTRTSNTLDKYIFYDGFGKPIQIKQEAENSEQIVYDIYYNEFNKIKQRSNPYFTASFENYTTSNQSVDWVNYSYDQLDRIIKITNADDTKKNINYSHWNITLLDENSNQKQYGLDAYNQIIEIKEHNNNEIYTTQYEYDELGNIISITDELNNTLNFTYDSLGRRTQINDPDLGIWNYSYDVVGNLIGQTDNRNVVISMQYDELDRIIEKNSTDKNITYVYDQDKNNTLSQTQTFDLVVNHIYDNKLRKIGESKTIDDLTFVSNWAYDSLDRKTSTSFSSGKEINYTYGAHGKLSSVLDEINIVNISYNPQNQILTRLYGNTLYSNLTYYDKNFRLKKIKTENKQELDYSYDDVGNVKEINDTENSRFFSMKYDDLNRLTYTGIINYTSTSNKILNFTYNAIGNMLNITLSEENNEEKIDFYYNGILTHAPNLIIKIILGLLGDTNGDCIVDIFDFAVIGLAYESEPEDPNWNPNADVYPTSGGDNIIDIFDLATVGLYYGGECANGSSDMGIIESNTSLEVNAPSKEIEENETFVVNIDFNTTSMVYASEFELYFNSSTLEVLNVTEGTFLNEDGTNTYTNTEINNGLGKVSFANTRMKNQSGINGSGILANITFKAKNNGSSDLDLENIKISDENLTSLNATIIDGTINIFLPNDTSKLYIKDSGRSAVAWFGNFGDIVLKGTCNVLSSCLASSSNLFTIGNSSDSVVSYINSTGDLCAEKGSCSASASCNPLRDAFKIRNASQDIVSYIDFDGELCFTGGLYENTDL